MEIGVWRILLMRGYSSHHSFEAVFAIAGLLAVAYLIRRR
jgi:PGF-CTERM protein